MGAGKSKKTKKVIIADGGSEPRGVSPIKAAGRPIYTRSRPPGTFIQPYGAPPYGFLVPPNSATVSSIIAPVGPPVGSSVVPPVVPPLATQYSNPPVGVSGQGYPFNPLAPQPTTSQASVPTYPPYPPYPPVPQNRDSAPRPSGGRWVRVETGSEILRRTPVRSRRRRRVRGTRRRKAKKSKKKSRSSESDSSDSDDSISTKVIIYPFGPNGASFLCDNFSQNKKKTINKICPMPLPMFQGYCSTPSGYSQEWLNGWRQGMSIPTCPSPMPNCMSSFTVPNSFLTPVLCPSANMNFSAVNTTMQMPANCSQYQALDTCRYCEIMGNASAILDKYRIVEDALDKAAASRSCDKNSLCGGHCSS